MHPVVVAGASQGYGPSASTNCQKAAYSGPDNTAFGAGMFRPFLSGSMSTAIPQACMDVAFPPMMERLLKQPPYRSSPSSLIFSMP
ncbi:hypothetical protein C1O40_11410 [Akkermansia muciniphila]|uniref:hypothetical protein n=1 Tax=Akkermansia muciniphila TaxID=239935 RepID=UPI000FE15562|nr:hypothetical protein [Akkermansia muciniphila]QAA49067.1 hypothetical protein C1O40_11410 [Akkermansia muciniphila]UQT44454.1 hypothetical protein M5E88_18260 [Akkermansia muciniphila]